MIHDFEAELPNGRTNWVLTRLPNLELNFSTLIHAMDCADDPLSFNVCSERYTKAILAFICCKDYNTYVDENDAQWLDDPAVKEFFMMDAMYFRTVNPSYRFITNVRVLSSGDIILEY